jgi:hypothetical protein
MITTKLEDLIFKGRASFKTYIAGGGQKCTLNIKQDHFIVITDITFFSALHLEKFADRRNLNPLLDKLNTQVAIFSDKAFNRFIFRNNFSLAQVEKDVEQYEFINLPSGNCTINTYLIHTDNVSFTFSYAKDFNFIRTNIAPAVNPAQSPFSDYGKDGLNNSLVVNTQMSYQDPAGRFTVNPLDLSGTNFDGTYRELAFPVTADTAINDKECFNSFNYDILHVNYVEIKGKPTDLTNR